MRKKIDSKSILMVIISGIIFAISVNIFLIPSQIYNGGIVGFARLIRDFIVYTFNLHLPFDIVGLINLIINIPIFIFAWSRISRSFVILSFIAILTQTIALSIIPIPAEPIVSDIFVSCLIAAFLGAYSTALAFRVKASSGGLDVIAVYLSQHRKLSVGKVFLFINAIIYTICLIVYNVEIALYSLIYSIMMAYGIDRFHEHNIEVSMMVFTKNRQIKHQITREFRRGVTHWDGFGAYTNEGTDVFVTIVAKNEVQALKHMIRKEDPKAFIIITQNLQVDGEFEKRLI